MNTNGNYAIIKLQIKWMNYHLIICKRITGDIGAKQELKLIKKYI